MTKIAFLGTGAMGSRMARHLIEAGHEVRLYNRHASRAQPLVALGASLVSTPAEAVEGANIIFSMVRDDAASDSVWLDEVDGAIAHLTKGAIAVESSTVSPRQNEKLNRRIQERGVRFVEAPVAGTLPQAEAGELTFLLGGEEATVAELTPILLMMGAKVVRVGNVGSGAAFKLVVNGMLGVQVAAISELLSMSERMGLNRDRTAELLQHVPVTSAAVTAALPFMQSGKHPDWFPVELMEKDFCIMTDEEGQFPLLEASRTVYRRSKESGSGARHLTAIAELYRK